MIRINGVRQINCLDVKTERLLKFGMLLKRGTGSGERGTGNGERKSGNELSAVTSTKIQNGGMFRAEKRSAQASAHPL